VELVLNDSTLNMGPHYFQSLVAHLDMFGLCPLERYHGYQQHLMAGPFRKWPDMPAVVSVTLVVPHVSVSMFDDLLKGNGTPICHLQLQSSVIRGESIYPDIQLGFGTVTASGTPFTDGYTVCVKDDPKGCKGVSPLIVSAAVSTGSLIDGGDPACGVVFGLKHTPSNLAALGKKLGMMLHLHKSSVGRKDVFVTKNRPNMEAHASMHHAVVQAGESGRRTNTLSQQTNKLISNTDDDVTVVVQPRFDVRVTKVSALHVRFNINAPTLQKALQNAAIVSFDLLDPFTLVLKMSNGFAHTFILPLPLDYIHGLTRVARKSLWVEYQAPVTSLAVLAPRPGSVFPVMRDSRSTPVLEHLHYVMPDCLPNVHVGKSNSHAKWVELCTSIAATMSATEFSIQKRASFSNIASKPGRLGIKESIYMMYMHVFGLCNRERAAVFNLQSASAGIALIIVDAVRMDTSNQSVFLDAAVIPFNKKNGPALLQIVQTMQHQNMQLVSLLADENEIPLWLHLLPAFVERCRPWTHKATCEYKAKGANIPLSTQLFAQIMCTCGTGIFPEEYLKNNKQVKAFLKHAVRAAIPVIYASPVSPGSGALPFPFKNTANPQPGADNQARKAATAKLRIEDLDLKKGICFACDAKMGKDKPELLSCGGCKFAQYCSKECQVKDWRAEHKHMCKQLKESGGQ
jgi:hypothetical protein